MAKQADYQMYTEFAEFTFLGKRCRALDLSRELSPDIPVYPGHMKVAMWTHLTHEESRMRLGDTPFRGYAVKGLALCDHDSTHMDAIYHFHPDRPDLTIETFPIEKCFTEGVWIDVSDVPPRTHITLDRVERAMDEAGIERLPAGGSLLYYTGAARLWPDSLAYCSQYPVTYPNHRACAEYLVNHTEVVNNIERIPMHQGFSVIVAPLRIVGATGSPVRVFAVWEA
jgi:kynurenine formamidase